VKEFNKEVDSIIRAFIRAEKTGRQAFATNLKSRIMCAVSIMW